MEVQNLADTAKIQTDYFHTQNHVHCFLGQKMCHIGRLYTQIQNRQCRGNIGNYGQAFKNKRRGLLSGGVILFPGNDRPNTVRVTQRLIVSFSWLDLLLSLKTLLQYLRM